MDAVKFLKEFRRMCDTSSVDFCRGCPLKGKPCSLTQGDRDLMVMAVEKWSAEHPVKTRLTDFLEKFPNAPLVGYEKMPILLPASLGYCETTSCRDCEYYSRGDVFCWNLPLEE